MQPKTFSHPELIKKFSPEVKALFQIFGEEIRIVGGAVRDLLLQKEVHDFDFCTKYLPDEIIKILNKNKIKAIPTGVKFGTITAVVAGKNFEITTLRKDDKTDGRHCEPEFVSDYFLDAQRRDFTINALYLDSAGLVSDYFDGISDIKKQKVRFIGEAKTRIEEDYLRILRFFRFSCQYAAELDVKGLAACASEKENLKKLSKERVRAEVLKMLLSEKKENLIAVLKVFKEQKIADSIFSSKLDIEALERLFKLGKEFDFSATQNLKIAALFFQKEIDLKIFAQEICATNLEKKYFLYLLNALTGPRHEDGVTPRERRDGTQTRVCHPVFTTGSRGFELGLEDLKQLLAFADKDLVLDLYLLSLAKNSDLQKNSNAKKNIKFLQNFSLPNFPIGGEDVINLGFTGQAAGKAIEMAKKFWAANDFKLQKTDLIKFLKTH